MSSVRALLLSSLLIVVSLSHVAIQTLEAPSKQSEVGPRNNPVDFEVTGIELGNSSYSPRVWDQPDSSTLEYMTKSAVSYTHLTLPTILLV